MSHEHFRTQPEGAAGHQARHDPDLGREQPHRPRDRDRGRHQRGDPGPHPREGRLQRHPDRLRRDRRLARSPSRRPVTSTRPGSPRVATWPRSVPSDAPSYEVGQELGPDTFAAGQEVDVTGTSKGKGYAGVMKLHGFHGVGASHGAHRNHRKPGSIGACATPGRVFKGTRMAGRMGTRHRHHPERHRARRRRREGPDPAQGCRSRPQGRPRRDPLGRQEDRGGRSMTAEDR